MSKVGIKFVQGGRVFSVETELELPKYSYTVISKVQVIKPVNYILVVDDSTSMANNKVADGTTTRIAAATRFFFQVFINKPPNNVLIIDMIRYHAKIVNQRHLIIYAVETKKCRKIKHETVNLYCKI